MLNAMKTLTNNEQRTIINALYTAAEKYRECAKEIAASDMAQAGKDCLVAQFKKQADECSEILEKIEDAD